MTGPQTAHENRLAQATSPYLLQHAHNPVDWWQWGPEALERAKRENKPILLSVGYAACHWCHVMAHESFEDAPTAAVMNELFVNIKVDREERPDIDQIYMNALHLLGEQGGWPLTMFLTPAGEPVWGGTYFPKTSRFGRPAFVDVLREVARMFREEPDKIEQNRNALLARLAQKARPADKVTIGIEELNGAATQIANAFDPVHGGLRGAPKFPQPAMLEFLWRAGLRSGDVRFFETVEHTLEHMCEGGIYDHLGGGFSRYSVDQQWLVPHFEKMLYDNAQLLELLALAWQRSGNPLFAERARQTVDWLTREMVTKEGAFSASLDADSEGEEGKFYVWSLAAIEAVLGTDAADFAQEYDVNAGGNFEWNGLMIAALVRAALILAEPSWIDMARRAFDFIAGAMTQENRLGHSFRSGKTLYPGLASDFANMIDAALALYEATGERPLLEQALSWQRTLDTRYADPETGGYFLTADDAEGLVVRPHSTADDATPNPNAMTAANLVRLATLTGDVALREKADRLIEGITSAQARNLFGHVALLNALDLRLRAAEIVVTGSDEAFTQAALKLPYLDRIVLRAANPADLPASHPAQDKLKAAQDSVARAAAFICVGERCSLPVARPEHIAQTIAAMRGA
jgi:uncharacterized protein YyaL (SSP411 family)